MKKILLVLTACAMSVWGADATGKWTGTLTRDSGDGGTRPAYMVLKQEGTKLTGTAGPNASEQFEIAEGTVEEGRVRFRLPQPQLKFDLKLTDDELSGDVTQEKDGQTERGKVSVKREK